MKKYVLTKEVEAISRIDDWVYRHSINDDYKEIDDAINTLQKMAYKSTIGKWLGKPIAGYSTVRCSNCNAAFMENNGRWKYCPECGITME